MPDWMINIPEEEADEAPRPTGFVAIEADGETAEGVLVGVDEEFPEVSEDEIQRLRKRRQEVAAAIFRWDRYYTQGLPSIIPPDHNLIAALYNGGAHIREKLAGPFPTLVQVWDEWRESDCVEFYEMYDVREALQGESKVLKKYDEDFGHRVTEGVA